MKKNQAFTLIELLVVISIIALLASVILASLNTARENSRLAAGVRFTASTHNALGSESLAIWYFDEGSGTTANDSSGQGKHAPISGATYIDGLKGKALSFDGINDWVDVPALFTGTAPNLFTVVGVINPGNVGGYIINPDSHGIDQNISYDATNQRLVVRIAESADTNERSRYSTNNSVLIGKWTHWAVSIKDKDIKIYINGALNAQYTESINIGTWTGNWRIGQRGNSTNWYLGSIDELRVYAETLAF